MDIKDDIGGAEELMIDEVCTMPEDKSDINEWWFDVFDDVEGGGVGEDIFLHWICEFETTNSI